MSLRKLRERVKNRENWPVAVHELMTAKQQAALFRKFWTHLNGPLANVM